MKTESSHQNIFSSSHHFTNEELIRFHHHMMTDAELHDMEKHLVDCELCSEALKGIAEMENATVLVDITKDLHLKARRRNLWKKNIFSQYELVSILAVVFLILFLLLMSIFFFGKKELKRPLKEKNKQELKS